MFTLAAADTLAGVASAASEVTCTIFGMELNAGTEVYKVLDQRQLAAAAATIYTVPASTTAFVKTITVVNTDTAQANTFQLFRGGTAAANAITPALNLAPGGMAVYSEGVWTTVGTLFGGWHPGVMGSSGCKGATFDRTVCPEVNTTIGTTGQVFMQAVWLPAGTVVSNIKIWSATTAAGTPTHYNAGLYDTSGNLLATGTDKTSTAWAANTLTTFAMATPYTVTASGLFYIAVSVVATTVPTMKGTTAKTGGQANFATPNTCGLSATTYATGNMPATLALPAAAATTSLYAEVS